MKNILTRLGMQDGEAIESKMVTRRVEAAQKKVEERNFEIRKTSPLNIASVLGVAGSLVMAWWHEWVAPRSRRVQSKSINEKGDFETEFELRGGTARPRTNGRELARARAHPHGGTQQRCCRHREACWFVLRWRCWFFVGCVASRALPCTGIGNPDRPCEQPCLVGGRARQRQRPIGSYT